MNLEKVLVFGHKGMVGSAILRQLKKIKKIQKILTISRKNLDLTNQADVHKYIKRNKPTLVIICAAKVGGIEANSKFPAEFLYENSMIEANIIHSSYTSGVKNLLFLGSSCIYPKLAKQPIKEEYLLSHYLEPTNEAYAIAKILGLKLCESYSKQYGLDYRSIMPSNLYGQGDNYHPTDSHVIPALIRRFHNAKIKNLKEVSVWGSGKPKREFLYVDDLAKACVSIINTNKKRYRKILNNKTSHINVGYGTDITIKELIKVIAKVTGYKEKIKFDTSKPDGTPRKLLDISLIKTLGWKPTFDLESGLNVTYEFFKKEKKCK